MGSRTVSITSTKELNRSLAMTGRFRRRTERLVTCVFLLTPRLPSTIVAQALGKCGEWFLGGALGQSRRLVELGFRV